MSTARTDSARIAVRKVLRDARDKNKWRKVVRFRLWMPVVLQLILIGLVMWYAESKFPGFINERNVTSVLFLAVPLAIVAMGQTHALLVGALDLSVGAMVTFGVVIASFLIGTDSTNVQILMGSAVILLAGVGLGLVNSGLILGFKIPSIIATLATLSILNGISLTLRETSGGRIDRRFTGWLSAEWGPIPIAFIGVVLGALAFDYWLHASGSGLQLRSAGFDERSAKRNGVRTTWVRARAILLAALLAAVASFFVMARSSIGNAQIGDSYALASITAAVLGGAALSGGRATFLGATVASVLLALIVTALPFLDLSAEHGLMITGILVLLGIVLFQLGDLKELVKRNYKRARRVAVGSKPPKTTEIPELYPEGVDFAVAPTGRTLIKDGLVLSMDPAIGDLPRGDVLIDGDRIVEVGRDLTATDAEVIDATGMIVMPGFVDTHRHIWEGLLRNIGTDVPLEGRSSYISHVLHKLAPAFRPEDAYIGDLVSALGAIDAGITTLLDWSHIQGSPAHTDAVVQALQRLRPARGVRLRVPVVGQVGGASAQLVRAGGHRTFLDEGPDGHAGARRPGPEFTDFEVSRDHWKLAREADARITTHVGVGSYGQDGKVQEMGEAGLLGPDTTYIHCTTLNDTEIQMIVDTGGTVSLASPVEMMMGHGMPPIQKFLDRGLRPSLSVDVETNVPSDMFNQMRSVLSLQGAQASDGEKRPFESRDVLACATIDGAAANGLEDKVGSLTPGKQADIILLRTDRMNVMPLNDPATAVVVGMDTSNVDTVLIAGRVMKRHGELLYVDWPAVKRMVDDARDHVLAKSGFKLPSL